MLAALVLATATLLPAPPAVPAAAPSDSVRWTIDATHSELLFRVRHLVSRVTGTFTKWEGALVADPADWNAGAVEVTIDAASIDTKNERRDRHLRSADFFDVENHPTLTFRSTGVTVQGDQVTLRGDLTIRGVTRPVELKGEFLGLQGAAGPKQRAGFTVATRINRLDYGLTWNRAAEGGGLVLADDVDIEITIAAVRQ